MRKLRDHLGDHRGQSVVEFVLMLPFLMFFMLFIIEFGLLLYVNVTVNNSVREAVRYAAVNNLPSADDTCDPGSIEERAVNASGGILQCDEVDVWYVDVTGDGLKRGDSVVVLATHPYSGLTFFGDLMSGVSFSNLDLSIRACSDGRLENAFDNPLPAVVVTAESSGRPTDWPVEDCNP